MHKKLDRCVTTVSSYMQYFAAFIILPTTAILITVSALSRYIIHSPIIWVNEVIQLCLLVLLTAPLLYVWDLGKHLRMDLAYSHFNPKVRRVADFITMVIVFAFVAAGFYEAINSTLYAITTSAQTEILSIPEWPFWIWLSIALGLFALRLLLALVQAPTNPQNS